MSATPDAISEAVTVQIAKLELRKGDMLAVMSSRILTDQQRGRICEIINPLLPEGVKAIVLDGGMTLAKVEDHTRGEESIEVEIRNAVRENTRAVIEALRPRKISGEG